MTPGRYDYVWTRYGTLNEQEDLHLLPEKLQGDLVRACALPLVSHVIRR